MRDGDRVGPETGAWSSVGTATQATQQIIAFMALGAWFGVWSGEDRPVSWPVSRPVSWQGAAVAGDAEAPTAPSASTDRALISSNRD